MFAIVVLFLLVVETVVEICTVAALAGAIDDHIAYSSRATNGEDYGIEQIGNGAFE